MEEIVRGGAFCVGHNVTAFDIMPNRFKSSDKLDARELALAAFADYDPEFAKRALDGVYRIIVAGKNFGGGGKTIEGPVFALKGAGIGLVVAESLARFFFRNSINNAFPVLVCPGVTSVVKSGDEIEVNLRTAIINNLSTSAIIRGQPLSANLIAILADGGLVDFARKAIAKKG